MGRLLLGLIIAIAASAYVDAKCQYNGFLDCLSDTINNEWKQLDSDGDGKLSSDRAKAVKCLRTVSCTKSCEPAKDFKDEIDDGEIKDLVAKVQTVWDKWPRTMQTCFLEKVRTKFFNALESKVQAKVPDFDLPDDLGPLPMPPVSMYKNKRQLLIDYVGQKLGSFLCLQPCEYEDKKKVVRCMKKEIDGPLGKCVSEKICTTAECKKSFKPTCSAVSQSIQDILKDTDNKLSAFDDGTQSSALKELKECRDRTKAAEPDLVESDYYKPSDYIKLFQSFTHVKKAGKTEKFKTLIKDLLNAYFDGDAFCTSQEC